MSTHHSLVIRFAVLAGSLVVVPLLALWILLIFFFVSFPLTFLDHIASHTQLRQRLLEQLSALASHYSLSLDTTDKSILHMSMSLLWTLIKQSLNTVGRQAAQARREYEQRERLNAFSGTDTPPGNRFSRERAQWERAMAARMAQQH
jgi:hypothetical protein